MRKNVRIGAAIIVIALIAYGIIQPIDREGDGRWLICIWTASLFMGVFAWSSLPQIPRSLNRNLQHLGIVLSIGFLMLGLQLLRQQVVKSHSIYSYTVTDSDTGQVTSNIRPIVAAQKIKRGKIIDANGTVLVDSVLRQENYVQRVYPMSERYNPAAFGNLVGFFSFRYGASGLEASYNDYLNGEEGSAWRNLSDSLLGRQPVGNNIHLTLNADLQQRAYDLLGGRTGSVVVLEPRTGKVLALVSTPGFDPAGLVGNPDAEDQAAERARTTEYWSQITSDAAGQPLLNRATQGQYPPGSSFKTVTAIGVLSEPSVGKPDEISCPNELFTETGAPPVVNAVRDGLEGLIRQHGDPRLESVYAYSCNTAFAQYALRLGSDRLTSIAERLDFYRPQNAPSVYPGFTDLPTAPSLLFVQPGFLQSQAALADTGYGQGQLLVTPLQMAMVAAAIANDGTMMRPYLVERITDPNGNELRRENPRRIRQAMTSDVARAMRQNMRAGVSYGFGAAADAVPGVEVGGKSGTAEYGNEGRTHAWFIAIAPYQEPRFAVAVMVEGGGEGSSVGAQLAGQVLAAAFELVP